MHCTYRVTYYYGRNICALLFSVGEGLLVSLCIRRPPIWDIMDILQGAWNPHQRVPFLKLCPPPKIHTYTQGIEKKKKPKLQKSFGNHSFSGRPDKDTFFIFGYIPSTCSLWSNSLWIYCPWIYHTSFCKRLFSSWATSQNNGYHMLTIHHVNWRFDFIYPQKN